MSLDNVVEDIRDEARARAEEIRQDGQEQADDIIAAAESDAENILESRKADIEQQIEREREQALSSAKLEAKQARLGARRDVLQRVREQVENELAELEGDRREELTRSLLDAAAVEFEDEDEVSVYGRAEDADLLETILADYDGYEVAGERDCLGGVVVEGENSRVRVNNTFDSVLNTVWEDNLKEVSTRLFDDQ
ncbi:V-type ATP synthase subunit E [Haloferax mediterranei ATCC 33500]|uniref:A-type ATP synthase subunit E n=1 Tax=Haloferax mediterranei (strain ATCC 33500 / DSM 1411 / JCM 8866 / NBRC 14739 / NCIMB 2177 / R-4) TaxID=523841 RepID=I3R1C8_HALMT|nr:V-type ATP synthase subunit E [Haloferax mediterranei]AFK18038.1 A-type ATP synthase subunit E [Haloferax mediterranei ATCC 33500]AHZ22548.1 ATP synthase subunit E [Haloferax mediterranei ATCC 33500]EMA02686.1 V-type ATP synthase subunit E [Haloferax mediterranei ATCC 33500]MDX5988130.1 V-type ATP synthase subunit E [Haloferax mediterranei ATCC 33500]QCQ74579.1 V-type ATP synthase subunit E [Haloferax mediterranei ATCC 33500]